MRATLPKTVLRKTMKRFLADRNRGISLELFADLCGISKKTLQDVFINEEHPLTEYIQRRVSKGYTEWKNGEVAIMQNRDTSKFVQYRKEAKPVLHKTTGSHLVNGEIRIKVGINNRYDYDSNTLIDELERG